MNKELKRIMTDLAAGHISRKEAELLIKPKKTSQDKPVKETEGKSEEDTHKRKKASKSREVNK